MRVLQVITKGEVGGAQRHLLALCRELARQGVTVRAAIGGSEPDGPLAEDLGPICGPVHRIAALGNSWHPSKVISATYLLFRLVRQESPDLLHAHSAMAGVVARLAGALAGVPVIYTVHGFAFKPENAWQSRVAAFPIEWLLAPLTSQMICVSEHERQLALKLPLRAHRVTVVSNGIPDVDTAHISAATDPATIVMVARMASPKRPDLLLEAAARLRQRMGAETPVLFLGSGPDLTRHRELAARLGLQAVRFAGDLRDVPSELRRHAILVLMSDHEGLPMSLIEGMRAGMAIVASDLPGIRELLPDAGQARLVASDAESLALALRPLLESQELRVRMGTAARRRYEQRYTAARMEQAVQSVYAAALSRAA